MSAKTTGTSLFTPRLLATADRSILCTSGGMKKEEMDHSSWK
jgi:hypothetical protein